MKIKTQHGTGSHLTLDCFGCDNKALDDMELIKNILNELPKKIGMHILSGPDVIRHDAEDKMERGITGFVIIAESHISIHTYPEKGYLACDIFSCREFDCDQAIDYLKEKLSIKKIEKNLLKRGYSEEFNPDKYLEPIKGMKINQTMTIPDLIKGYKNVGFQATHVAEAYEAIRKMKQNKATVFLSFTSNMVSSGLRELFAQLVKEKLVDAIITSTGSIEEDIMKTKKPFLLGKFNSDDYDLHRKGINRIGNIYVPNDRYMMLEDHMMDFFRKIYEKQKIISPSEMIYELGKTVEDENSILYWASKNGIPIFCPGITDGAIGLNVYFFKQKYADFGIDVTADMKQLADIVLTADKTAGIILGGGIAKHHTLGVNILRGGLDYAVYVSTATEADGSLSGARPKEAVSWSKINEEANHVHVEGDATIIFPLIAGALELGGD